MTMLADRDAARADLLARLAALTPQVEDLVTHPFYAQFSAAGRSLTIYLAAESLATAREIVERDGASQPNPLYRSIAP